MPVAVQATGVPMSDTPRTKALTGTFYLRCDDCPQPEKCEKLESVHPDDYAELERELAEIRAALAGTDYASLPSDFPTVRMAHTIRADHDKFLQQVRDTCVRAEKAETMSKSTAAETEQAESDRDAHRQAAHEGYNQDALDAASRELHMFLLREGSSYGTKACEEIGRVFMTAYRKAAP